MNHLIEDWGSKLWRLWSVRIIALAAAMQAELLLFPDTLRSYIPDKIMHAITVALLLIGIYARLVRQTIPSKGDSCDHSDA